MTILHEKFATQVNADILAALRSLAQIEGKQIQKLIKETLSDLLEKHKREPPRPHVMAAYKAIHQNFAAQLAK